MTFSPVCLRMDMRVERFRIRYMVREIAEVAYEAETNASFENIFPRLPIFCSVVRGESLALKSSEKNQIKKKVNPFLDLVLLSNKGKQDVRFMKRLFISSNAVQTLKLNTNGCPTVKTYNSCNKGICWTESLSHAKIIQKCS